MSSVAPNGVPRAVLYTAAERSRLAPDLLVASRLRGYLQALGNIAIFLGVLLLARDARTAWQILALFVASGFALHRLFFPVHDCIHYSLFPSRGENRFFGAILSGLLGTSFDAIRDQHLDHHRDFGTPEDPGAADYFPRFHSRRQLVVFLAGPLLGSILIAKLGDYVRPTGNKRAPRGEQVPAPISLSKRLSAYAPLFIVQAGVCALLTHGFQIAQLWRYIAFNALPAVTIFLFLIRLRMFLEHGALNYDVCNYAEGKRPTARTIYASSWERLLLCGSDFNYHHEHHLYPVVPGRQLKRLHQKLLASGLDPEDVRVSYFQALAEIWSNLGDTSSRLPERSPGGSDKR